MVFHKAIYYLKIVFVFFICWMPGLLITTLSVIVFHSEVAYFFGGTLLAIQPILSFGTAMTNDEIRGYVSRYFSSILSFLLCRCCRQKNSSLSTSSPDSWILLRVILIRNYGIHLLKTFIFIISTSARTVKTFSPVIVCFRSSTKQNPLASAFLIGLWFYQTLGRCQRQHPNTVTRMRRTARIRRERKFHYMRKERGEKNYIVKG